MWFKQQSVTPEWQGRFSFVNEGVVEMAPDELFDLLVGCEAWPDFFPDMLGAEYVTDPPHGVGSKRIAKTRTQNVREHFTAYERGKRWTFYVDQSTLPLVSHFMEDYRFEPTDGGTRLLWSVHYKPRVLLRPLHPVLAPIFAKMFRDALANLQRYVVERAESPAATG